MSKTHPLTIIQFFLAILWAIPSFILIEVEEAKQFTWFFISIVPFIGLSVVTTYLGWLMIFKKVDIVYPFENFGVKVTKKLYGKQAAKNLIAQYSNTSRKILIGRMNIFSGLLCFIGAIAGIVIILSTV